MCAYSGVENDTEDERLMLEDKWFEGNLPEINITVEERNKNRIKQLNRQGDGFDLFWGIVAGWLTCFFGLLIVTFTQLKGKCLNNNQRMGLRIGIIFSLLTIVTVIITLIL